MKISGIGYVYMITSPNGRIYVGSTVDFDVRWYDYRRLNCKDQCKLYNSLIKYGYENHSFEVVWAGDVNEMLKYETLIGWGFNVLDKDLGLNLQLPKLDDVWSSTSEETRKKLSILNKGENNPMYGRIGEDAPHFNKMHSLEIREKIGKNTKDSVKFQEHNKSKQIPILQYDLKGNFIKEWISCKEASKALSISKGNITSCCKGNRNHTGGFKWKYKN